MTTGRGDPTTTRVLGIDPGTRVVGFGVLDFGSGAGAAHIESGVLTIPPGPMAPRLEYLFTSLQTLIQKHRPQVLAIEEVFHGKNFQSVLKVGEARGVAILAAQLGGLEVCEYSPKLVKKSVTGNGGADKSQVQSMVARRLNLEPLPEPQDITDALAVAFCHGQRLWRGTKLGTSPAVEAARTAVRKNNKKKILAEIRESQSGTSPSKRDIDQGWIDSLVRSGKAVELTKPPRSGRESRQD